MLDQKLITALAAHGDAWCLDVQSLSRFVAGGERKPAGKLPKVNGSVAIIPIQGVITKRGDWFSDGIDRAQRTIGTALATKAIGGIVLDIDSPGGSSYGLQEFADWLFTQRGVKPLIAVANPLAASAAYWIGTSADQLIVSPSGDVGSVGVWSMHVDHSKMLDDIGLKPTFIFAGKYKVEGNPYEPLTDEARDEIQRGVDETYASFTGAIARNRGIAKAAVIKDFGEGRVLSAARAKAAGMVDRIASLDDVLIGMGATASTGPTSRDSYAATQSLLAAWNDTPPVECGTHIDALKRRRVRERSRT